MNDKSLESHLKILGTLNLITTFLILVTVICFSLFQFVRFNGREMREYTNSALYSIAREETRHLHLVRDYAVWDDMVEAVRTGDQYWMESAFFGSLATLDVQSFWIQDDTGILFSAKEEGYQELQIPTFSVPSGVTEFSFFGRDQGRVFRYQVVQIKPHLSAQRLVEPAYLISAIHWDDDLLAHFGTVTQSTIALTNAPEAKNSLFSMQYAQELEQMDTQSEPIFFNIQRENVFLVLFSQSVLLAIVLFIVILIPSSLINIIFQRRWILTPLTKIRALLSTHTHFYAPDTLKTKNELKILSHLTQEYIEQEQQAILNSQQMKEQAQRLLEANERIREELLHKERLSLVVENSTNGVLITDENMEIIYVNPSWERLNGYSSQEVVHQTPRVVKSGKTDDGVYKIMWESLNNG
ncbi:PAS domain S-box protein, partial [Candidatus Woesebacteria bacterium]|nr:PAS domain S-box protein [Candidatus Woesebacteria bacterium]